MESGLGPDRWAFSSYLGLLCAFLPSPQPAGQPTDGGGEEGGRALNVVVVGGVEEAGLGVTA